MNTSKIINRLNLIKSLILLEEDAEIKSQIEKFEQEDLSDKLRNIVALLNCKSYHEVLKAIDDYKNESSILIPYRKGDKWGYCNRDKKIIIDCSYSATYRFSNDIAIVGTDGKYGFINRQGKVIIPIKFYAVNEFSEGLAAVKNEENKWGIIDLSGETKVPCLYNWVGNFMNGLAIVNRKGLNGFIDFKGIEVIPCRYDRILNHQFYEDVAIVEIRFKSFLIDKKEKILTQKVYDRIGYFRFGFAITILDDKIGLIDKVGKEVLPCIYEDVTVLNEKFAECVSNTGTHFLYIDSGIEFDFYYDEMENLFISGRLNDEQKQEFISWYEGSFVQEKWGLEQRYLARFSNLAENIGEFNQGLAYIRDGDKYGYVNYEYQEVIPYRYYHARDFNEGLAAVSKTPLKEIPIKTSDPDVINYDVKGTYGFIDSSGREIIACVYDAVGDFKDGISWASRSGHQGYIDKLGNEYWED